MCWPHFYSRPCGRGDWLRPEDEPLEAGFLLTPLREGRPFYKVPSAITMEFLLTPLREGRRSVCRVASDGVAIFLLTPLREGRLAVDCLALANKLDFYSRPCGRGDAGRWTGSRWTVRFLLTPLREGRPKAVGVEFAFSSISTHAPAGGATSGGQRRHSPCGTISTHAPAGGATFMSTQTEITRLQFLLTPLREGRQTPAHPSR